MPNSRSSLPSAEPAGTRLRAPILAAVLTAFLGGALAGCGLRGERGGTETPSPSAAEAAEMTTSEDSESADPAAAPPEALLDQGRAMVVAGRFAEAVPILEAYLVFGDHPEHRVQAAWTLAMVYLLPDSPVRSQSRALPLLGQIVESHPGTVEALQAGWLRGLLQEQARQRTTLQEQEQSLRELNELVEQLKRIDLNRRPPGGGGGG